MTLITKNHNQYNKQQTKMNEIHAIQTARYDNRISGLLLVFHLKKYLHTSIELVLVSKTTTNLDHTYILRLNESANEVR